MPETPAIYGLMAEFDDPTSLVAAARRTREAGYRAFDAFSPYPIDELFDAMDCEDRRVPLFVLLGGIVGGLDGIRAAGLDVGRRLSGQRRRPAVCQLADVHSGHVRTDDPVRVAERGA